MAGPFGPVEASSEPMPNGGASSRPAVQVIKPAQQASPAQVLFDPGFVQPRALGGDLDIVDPLQGSGQGVGLAPAVVKARQMQPRAAPAPGPFQIPVQADAQIVQIAARPRGPARDDARDVGGVFGREGPGRFDLRLGLGQGEGRRRDGGQTGQGRQTAEKGAGLSVLHGRKSVMLNLQPSFGR